MFEWIAEPEAWVALATLTALEIVLGIDNIVFISILASKLPPERQPSARRLGLAFALLTRLLLLASIFWIVKLTAPLFTVLGNAISGRDLILIAGGLFLIAKGTREIHERIEGAGDGGTAARVGRAAATFTGVIVQIGIMDIIFSLDSVITAVGLVDDYAIMAIAIIVAIGVMMAAADPIGNFVDRHPTVKMLALSFLLLIGMALVADGLEFHIPKGYIYFALGFSILVEGLNLAAAKRRRRRRRAAG